jgi:hypothetical protein
LAPEQAQNIHFVAKRETGQKWLRRPLKKPALRPSNKA